MNSYNIYKELPGKHQFHSALLTTFSLDFYFLEQRVISALRKRGIRNISVIADARMTEDCIINMSRNIKNASSLYTLNTIVCAGAFHPKIHFYVGDDTLMCVIGSGNLSSGGAGKNHEVFTTLYADKRNTEQLVLLHEVWQYLKSISNNFKGISLDQIKWMEEHCNLLQSTVVAERDSLFLNCGDMQVAFMTNEAEPIFTKLPRIIDSPNSVSKITVASPYFDEHGKVLTELSKLYPKAKIDVLIQPERALLPLKFVPNSQIAFYDLYGTELDTKVREKIIGGKFLHSKLIHFQIGDKELLILGSANATDRGMLANAKSNKEAVVALYADKANWLSELGIKDVKTKIDLSKIKDPQTHTPASINPVKHLYKIIAIDLRQTRSKLYVDSPVFHDIKLVLFKRDGEGIFVSSILNKGTDTIEVVLPDSVRIADALYAACIDFGNNIVSNRQIVNNEQAIWNNNPSPENRKMSQLLEKIVAGDYSELDLFEYYDVIFGESNDNAGAPHRAPTSDKELKEKKESTYEEAKELYAKYEVEETRKEEFSISVLSQYLNSIQFQANKRDEDNIDNEENGDIATDTQQEHIEKTWKSYSSKSSMDKAKQKVVRYFENYSDKLTDIGDKEYKVMQSDYAFFILGLSHLIAIKNKEYAYKTKDNKEGSEILIPLDGPVHEYTSFHSIATNIIGKFLSYIQCSDREKEYANEFDQRRLREFKNLSIGLIFLSISTIYQKCKVNSDKMEKWHTLLMLNLIDVFRAQSFNFKEILMTQLRVFDLDDGSLIDTVPYLEGLYTNSNAIYESVKGSNIYISINNYKIVYIKNIGFCYIEKVIPDIKSPKCIKISNLRYMYDVNDFVCEEYYHIKRGKFLPGKKSH